MDQLTDKTIEPVVKARKQRTRIVKKVSVTDDIELVPKPIKSKIPKLKKIKKEPVVESVVETITEPVEEPVVDDIKSDDTVVEPVVEPTDIVVEEPVKRKRGRSRKHPVKEKKPRVKKEQKPKQPRGRPRKYANGEEYEAQLAREKEKILCECGSMVRRQGIRKHQTSVKCKLMRQNASNMEVIKCK